MKITKANGENVEKKWKKKIANYKIQIVMEIIDINRRNKKHTRYKYIRYQRWKVKPEIIRD